MKDNYTIAEYFTLPSDGKIYEKEVNPNIKLRSMTMQDEMRRLSPSDKPYQTLCSVVDDCILEGGGISSYDMCIGDYQYLLYNLRTITYGEEYKGQSLCPYCNSKNESKFDLDELKVKRYTPEVDQSRNIILPVSGEHVKLRLRTPRMLDTVQQKLKEFKSRYTSVDGTLLFSILSVVQEVDGAPLSPLSADEWVKKLNMQDVNLIVQSSDKIDSMIGVDTKLYYTCSICGMPYVSHLKTDNEFFRPSLDI